MKKELDLEKNITIVGNIYDFGHIISDLEKKAKECIITENLPELEESIEKIKTNVNNGEYDNSEIIAKYLKNKTGKYIVFCKNDAEIEEITKKCSQLFGKVNGAIEISALRKNYSKEVRSNLVKDFNESTDNTKLKLLFVNSGSNIKYDIENADGAILISTPTNWFKEKDKIIYKAISSCKDGGVIINNINSLYLLSKYRGIKNNIRNLVNGNVDFIEEQSIIDTEEARTKTFIRGISDSAKLKIIKEYKKEINKPITANTVYKGYNLGVWQNNLRQEYMNGTLKMEKQLVEEFENEGILGQRKRAVPTSDIEKYDLLVKYKEKYPERQIIGSTIDDNGVPIGTLRWALQVNVNANKSNLTPKQIEFLKKNNILNYGSDELENFAKEHNVSKKTAHIITMRYESIDEFVKLYKQGKADIKSLKLNKRGIIVSGNQLSQEQKQRYLNLIKAVFGKNILEDNSKFVIEEDIIKALNKLSEKERNILSKKIGIFEKKKSDKEILKETNTCRAYVYQVQERALKKLSKSINVYPISSLQNLKERFIKEFEKISNMSEEEWKDYHFNLDISYLEFSDKLTKRLKENGFNTLKDLSEASLETLKEVPTVGSKKINTILEKIEKKKHLTRNEKLEKLSNLIKNINGKISSYNTAFEYYMEKEDIFNQDETIPSSITEKSSLSRKKDEKIKKEERLEQLDTQIKEQDKKTEKLESVLESEGVSVENKIVEE